MNKVKLIDFVNDKYTDKNTRHSYIATYDKLFEPIQATARNVLEIGIKWGGSIKMLHDYFYRAVITGIDNKDNFPIKFIRNLERVNLYFKNAYDHDFINSNLASKQFDVIIDDGPHTFETQLFFLDHYTKLINKDGLVVVEDVKGVDSAEKLIGLTTSNLNYKIIDLNHERPNAKGGHYDNILIVGKYE